MKKITLTSYRESLLGLLLKMIYGKRNQNPFLPTSSRRVGLWQGRRNEHYVLTLFQAEEALTALRRPHH
ncbi:hypothetical protein HanOQP8_Chr17g0662141 [Helianthus annuus]|uniref:Uncharacterized protein n=1 Tax=Helianthus annuus TaxID=4232 RepID=A0A251RR37_HELAN|nr:hypothetical protein HanOQP8_Chr17g0662141 [Helianthus annuus]